MVSSYLLPCILGANQPNEWTTGTDHRIRRDVHKLNYCEYFIAFCGFFVGEMLSYSSHYPY